MATRTTNASTRARRSETSTSRGGSMTVTAESEYQIVRNCANVCNETLAYCLTQGGEHVEQEHIKMLIDCVDVCNVTANLVGRGSEFADNFKEICAEVSKACEESCEGFEGDETMARCAEACRECAAYSRA